jgi:hypothetical protein
MAEKYLNQKNILLGVTGSIAAYKAADLASKLAQAGALVDVILTGCHGIYHTTHLPVRNR